MRLKYVLFLAMLADADCLPGPALIEISPCLMMPMIAFLHAWCFLMTRLQHQSVCSDCRDQAHQLHCWTMITKKKLVRGKLQVGPWQVHTVFSSSPSCLAANANAQFLSEVPNIFLDLPFVWVAWTLPSVSRYRCTVAGILDGLAASPIPSLQVLQSMPWMKGGLWGPPQILNSFDCSSTKIKCFIIYVVTLLFSLNFSICKQSISKWISKYAAAVGQWLDWTSSTILLHERSKILIQNNSEAKQLSKRRINWTAHFSLLLQLIPVKIQINWVYCVFLPLTELSSLGCRLFFSSLCDWSSERKSPKLTKFSMLLIATFLMFLLKSFNRLVAIEFQSSSSSPRSSSMHALNRNIIINKYESKFPQSARTHETRDNSYKWSSKNFRNSWRWRFNKNSYNKFMMLKYDTNKNKENIWDLHTNIK